MEGHHCAEDSPAQAAGPEGHRKKQSIVALYPKIAASLQRKGPWSANLQRVSSCHRKVSDSLLCKLEAIPLPGDYLSGEKSPSTSLGNTWS